MKAIATLFLTLSCLILIISTLPIYSATSCTAASCHPYHGPDIHFPFRLINQQPARCGYPGFDLYCSNNNHTILNLTDSGEFVVNNIDYKLQTLTINDPGYCLPSRLQDNFTLSGSRFMAANPVYFTFYNCSSDRMEYDHALAMMTVQCDSVRNYTFKPTRSDQVMPAVCRRITDVSVPMEPGYKFWSSLDLLGRDLNLVWTQPFCGSCETKGGTCGYVNDTGLEIGCVINSTKRGLPRNAKLGILCGVGIPVIVCLIVLVSCYIRVRRASILRNHLNSGIHVVTAPAVRSPSGLDGHTIESYPKTVLGASRRLPDPSNITCSICLSDYQPQETLRTIPECNHYFHSDCIDDWLKLNGTCPLCRKLPQT